MGDWSRGARLVALALILLGAPPLSAQTAPRPAGIALAGARLWPAKDYTRLTIEARSPLHWTLFSIEAPERLVLDLEGVEPSAVTDGLPARVRSDDPWVRAIRVGRFRPGTLRVVLDLKAPVKATASLLDPVGDYGYRLVLDIYPARPAPTDVDDPLLAFLNDNHARQAAGETLPPGSGVDEPVASPLAAASAPGIVMPAPGKGSATPPGGEPAGLPPAGPSAPSAGPSLPAAAVAPATSAAPAGAPGPGATPVSPGVVTPPPGVAAAPPAAAAGLPAAPAVPAVRTTPPAAAPTATPSATGPAVQAATPSATGPAVQAATPAATGPAAPVATLPDAAADAHPPGEARAAGEAREKDCSRKTGNGRLALVAIDAGHGGEDPGARGDGGTLEKDVTLAVARRIRDHIDREPGLCARLVRDGDYFIPLQVRTAKARQMHADLFVSVHADAYITRDARGSSVFALSERGATSVAARWLANRENQSDLIGGVNLAVRDPYLAQTLFDLSQTATIQDSLRLGSLVLRELGGLNPLHRGKVEQAGFAVLKSPDIPSILVETAFITNPDEERRLGDPAYQERLAATLVRGIRSYVKAHPPQGKPRLTAAEPLP